MTRKRPRVESAAQIIRMVSQVDVGGPGAFYIPRLRSTFGKGENVKQNMKPDLPGLPTMSALLLAAILTAWLGIWGPISLEGLAKWQTLTGACIAADGVFVAAYNVTRQMRVAQN
jgi:hypothetical protein